MTWDAFNLVVDRCSHCAGLGRNGPRPEPNHPYAMWLCTDCRGRGVVCNLCRKALDVCRDSECKNAHACEQAIRTLNEYLSPLKP